MDLHSHHPYWLLRHGIIHSYPSLKENASADIVVMGGGISGVLTAWYLHQAGFDVLVVDRRHIGLGSTVASTTLLQYEIDVPLHELSEKIGEKNAVKSYQLCLKAINDLDHICKGIQKHQYIFNRKPSFQFASYQKDVSSLEKEFSIRKKNGIKLQWLDEKDIVQKFGFHKPAGLLSQDGAQMDAYWLGHALLLKGIKAGLRVYDHTGIAAIQPKRRGVELMTDGGKKIRCRKLVIACGYESQRYLSKNVQQLRSTYVITSEPFFQRDFWYKNSLIWETADPYLYIRTTSDNRIIVGGKDIPFSNAQKRDRLLSSKARALEKSFAALFPGIPFKTDFKWAGTFATTKDGLPYIGSVSELPHTYFALGFGGNGITFSVIAAAMIRDMLLGKKNPDAAIFSFDREG